MKYTKDKVCGYRLGSLPEAPIPELASLSRAAATEGVVLLKNEKQTLPLRAGDRVSLFGRSQVEYCKSGTGSGGAVCVNYVTNILDSLREHPEIKLNETLIKIYADWLVDHPFDKGKGWAQEPWCQQEMLLDEETVRAAAAVSDKALIVLGRTAGEDKDNSATAGSYYLTEEEETMLSLVRQNFDKVCVILNVGNIIDMKWVEKYGIDSVLYIWQGGMEGGRAAVDVLCGTTSPSGKLTDTIALDIEDYPSHKNFGSDTADIYQEDIYVGYRYFETFAPEKVLYPFGFGLSYTTFQTTVESVKMSGGVPSLVTVKVRVKNTGDEAGKEVVQVYLGAPQGKLGKAEKVLAAFAKTPVLAPGKSCSLKLSFLLDDFASYDDSGVTGHKSAYVLEAGQYLIYVGTDAHTCEAQAAYAVEERVVEQCTEALSPVTPFERMRPGEDGKIAWEPAPQRTYDLAARIRDRRPAAVTQTGDRGIRLADVRDGKATMEEFIAQLSDRELIEIARGEGMNSPKVTPGTGSCFGGVTEGLAGFGIPIACTTDGPSGLRMESGLKATSLPNGTLLACTWNLPLIYQLFRLEGVEMSAYKIDALLGPGINIHRHPLCGRNFEYFSEDPFLTGRVAAAMCAAVHDVGGVSCTIKHFACNNQEWKRHEVDSVVSERAVREIYLKPFEIAVKEGNALAIMTSYNLINGIHSASNYDLNTVILRDEWNYTGFVMTDWWANMNDTVGSKSDHLYLSLMVRAQNDVYMVDNDSATRQDDCPAALEEGKVTRGELQRCAANLCRYLMQSHAMERFIENGSTYVKAEEIHTENMECIHTLTGAENRKRYTVSVPESGKYALTVTYRADGPALAQIPISITFASHPKGFLLVKATEGAQKTETIAVKLEAGEQEISYATTSGALHIDEIKLYR